MSDQKIWNYIKETSPRPNYNEIVNKFTTPEQLKIATKYWLILNTESLDDILLKMDSNIIDNLFAYTDGNPKKFLNNQSLKEKIEKNFKEEEKKSKIITSNIECQYINIKLPISYNLNLDRNTMYALFDKIQLNRNIPFCKMVENENIYYKIHQPSKKDIHLQTICYKCKMNNIPVTRNTIGPGWICEPCWNLYNRSIIELKQESKKKEILFKDQLIVNPWRDLPIFQIDCKYSSDCAYTFPCEKKNVRLNIYNLNYINIKTLLIN